MRSRRPCRGWTWLIAGLLAFSAGPASIVIAWEPSCRMGCASTEYCCCKPRARRPSDRAALESPVESREACPEECSTLALPAPAKSSIVTASGGVGRDLFTTTTWTTGDRPVAETVHSDVDARAPPAHP